MKRVLVIALAIVFGMACSDCFAKKSKKQEVDPLQAYRDSVAMVEELQKLEEEMRIKKEMYELKKKAALEELNRSLMDEMEIPCQEEAKSTDEYYGVLGISENQMQATHAIQNANREALSELTKLVGDDIDLEKMETACRQVYRDDLGTWNAFIALKYPKNK